jgi:hypothetical protein
MQSVLAPNGMTPDFSNLGHMTELCIVYGCLHIFVLLVTVPDIYPWPEGHLSIIARMLLDRSCVS